jgi:hypothetical protein
VRGAVVGGAAYHAGKSVQRGREQDAAQDQQIADVQAQQAYDQQAAQQPAAAPDVTVELQKLADLKASGALTDEEFAAAKARLLGT